MRKVSMKKTDIPQNKKVKKAYSKKLTWSLAAVFTGLIIGWFILLGTGNSPVEYFEALVMGSFGSAYGFSNLLGAMTWLIPLGLAMVVSFRAGQFNIGATGQMMLGGFTAYIFAYFARVGAAGPLFVILISTGVGAVVAYLIAKLKTRFGIHEVISSIMINWIIFYFMALMTNADYGWAYMAGSDAVNLFSDPATAANTFYTPWMQQGAIEGTSLTWAIFLVIPLVIAFWAIYRYTSWGVKQDIVGSNMTAADYIGVNKNKQITQTMMVSGALAGLAGSILYLGVQGEIPVTSGMFDIPAEGFQGITLALIAFNSPLGIMASSAFLGIMLNAEAALEVARINPYVSDAIIAIIILLTAVTNFVIMYKPEEKIKQWMDGEIEVEWINKITSKFSKNKKEENKAPSKTSKTSSTKDKPSPKKANTKTEKKATQRKKGARE